MHNYPGVQVERNARLPPVQGDQTRRREIDVLLTGEVAGYPVRIAFQCKNERKPIEPELIDAFIGELDDVGIPPQHGIFVCVNGYTRGALDRAKVKGVRTLVLRGLTKDRLASEVAEAFQFNVYLQAEVRDLTITNKVSKQENEGQFLIFHDDEKNVCGTLPDLVVSRWQYGDPPSTIGEYTLNLDVPEGWNQVVAGRVEPVLGISAQVFVRGLVVELSGKTESHALVDPVTESLERGRVNVQFDLPQKNEKVVFPVRAFDTEEELEKFTKKKAGVRVVSRIRLPRIWCGRVYYPFSERVARKLLEQRERDPTLSSHSTSHEDLEGTNLNAAWEAPWHGFTGRGAPVLATDDEGRVVDVRLLMDAGEYARVVALRPEFERNPTAEFSHLLSWAYLMQGGSLTNKAKDKQDAGAHRLLDQAIEKINLALTINPNMPEAFMYLGVALRELGRYEDAVALYDRAISIKEDNYETWIGRAMTLTYLHKFNDAVESVNKSLTYAPDAKTKCYALTVRAGVHHLAGHPTEAANDVIAAWKMDADRLVEDDKTHSTIESCCIDAPSPETILLLTEMYWCKTVVETAQGNKKEASDWAERAVKTLESLVPVSEAQTQTIGTVSGELIEGVLLRSAKRLAGCGENDLAQEQIGRMQGWIIKMWGEQLESLTSITRELAATDN
jgi:tetratricopeptide (TPR) repeat protein